MDEDEASLGTRCSSRTGERSNSVDTTVFNTLHPSSEVLLWISSRDGSCTEDEAAIVRSSVEDGGCQDLRTTRMDDSGEVMERKISLHGTLRDEISSIKLASIMLTNSHDGDYIPLYLHINGIAV